MKMIVAYILFDTPSPTIALQQQTEADLAQYLPDFHPVSWYQDCKALRFVCSSTDGMNVINNWADVVQWEELGTVENWTPATNWQLAVVLMGD